MRVGTLIAAPVDLVIAPRAHHRRCNLRMVRVPGSVGQHRAVAWALPVLCAALVVLSWSQVRAGGVPVFDRRARLWVGHHRNEAVFSVLDVVKDLGSATYAGPALLLAAGVLSLRRHNPRAIVTAGLAVVLLAGITALLKAVVARPGPSGVGPPKVDGAWPSGHATTIVVVVLVLVALFGAVPERRPPVIAAAVLVPLVVDVGLVYCGHHWLSDVLVAAPLGYLIVRLARFVTEVLLVSSRPTEPSDRTGDFPDRTPSRTHKPADRAAADAHLHGRALEQS